MRTESKKGRAAIAGLVSVLQRLPYTATQDEPKLTPGLLRVSTAAYHRAGADILRGCEQQGAP